MKLDAAKTGVAPGTGDVTYFHGRDDALVPSRVPAPLTKSFETRSGAPIGLFLPDYVGDMLLNCH